MNSLSHYKKAYATYTLITINVLLFALMNAAGSSTADKIYRKGAVLVGATFTAAEWWRPLTANFLHKRVSHLALNLVGLLILGPLLEVTLGVKRYVFCYLVSGFGSMVLVIICSMILQVHFPQLIAGASGCLLGIVGARAAVFLRIWLKENDRSAQRDFILMVSLALFQVLFDIYEFDFHISLNLGSHVNGLLIGFLTALFFKVHRTHRTSRQPLGQAAKTF